MALQVPTIDISELGASSGAGAGGGAPGGAARDAAGGGAARDAERVVAAAIDDACRTYGFFQIVGHGIDPALRAELRAVAAEFFALPAEVKATVAMEHGGRAWRGWFPLGDELTSGVPDDKEGYYFGDELDASDPRVVAGTPLHGPNLFPTVPVVDDEFAERIRRVVLEWIAATTAVGRRVLRAMAIAFDLDPDWFDRWCADPTVLFRMFHYPPPPDGFPGEWGVAEHTDYGLLTLLVQDDTGGLEVRVDDAWVDVPPTPDAIVCNIGDMLERATGGQYLSTLHRVHLPSTDRYSFPLFLDPGWDTVPGPIPGFEPNAVALERGAARRWDGRSVFDAEGTYGDYLTDKVAKVFPALSAVLED